MQFHVREACTLNGIWFYSDTGAVVLPQVIALYVVSGQSLVHSESASWSGLAASGWVFAAFTSPPSLTASVMYEGCVLQDTSQFWYTTTTGIFSGSDIVNGPLTGPSAADATGAQGAYNSGTSLAYPASGFSNSSFWVDIQVTPPGAVTSGPPVFPGITQKVATVAFRAG